MVEWQEYLGTLGVGEMVGQVGQAGQAEEVALVSQCSPPHLV
jgi:hypothetical protein